MAMRVKSASKRILIHQSAEYWQAYYSVRNRWSHGWHPEAVLCKERRVRVPCLFRKESAMRKIG